jgi:hypothetical protein
MSDLNDAREALMDLAADGAFVDLSEERVEYQLTGHEDGWTRLLVALGFNRKHEETWVDAIERAIDEDTDR